MNSSHWEKLRKNLSLLQKEIDADELVPYLIEKDVLQIGSRERFRRIPSNDKKIEELLLVLKNSPPEKEAYKYLLDALKSCEFEEYCQIADKIDATATKCDPSVHAKVDPSHYEDSVRQVLDKHFINKHGQTTSLDQIRSALDNKNVFKTTPWSDDVLTSFVCSMFAGTDVLEKPSVITGHKKVFFKHLTKLGSKDECLLAQASLNKTCSQKRSDQHGNVASLTPTELTRFLRKEIEEANMSMSTAPLAEMEKEEINGNIFLEMNENELEKVMPSSTFGLRRILKSISERFKEKSISGKNQFARLRSFDLKGNPCDCYIQGHCVDFKVQTRGNKLAPIRNFHHPELNSDNDVKDYIIIYCATFAAACINERQNGTIHFGISPNETGSEGLIMGLHLSPEDFDDQLLSLFFPSQHHLIKTAVRHAQFIHVVKDDKSSAFSPQRYVIEFDIVPGAILGDANQFVKINAKHFPEPWKSDRSQEEPVFVFSNGKPFMLPPGDVRFNTKLPSSTISQRRQEEREEWHRSESDCLVRLRNHLTGGSNKMEDDVHKIILVSSVNRTSGDLESLEFIQSLQPDAVFDFNPKGYDEGIFKALEDQEEVLKVLSLDDFDEKRKSKTDIDNLRKELNGSSHTQWMFCNGYKDIKKMEATQWNMERRPAFRKAFYHYLQNCNKGRLLIIMCLFSYSDIFVEACDEILLELPRQWILLSGHLPAVEKWQKILKGRNRVYTEDLKQRCIGGLPWEQVNRAITAWCYKDDSSFECQIPHSSSVPVIVEKKKINEWSDIEVLYSSDPSFPDEKTLRDKQKQVEEQFYSGGQVQWLNFFSEHVCRRKIHEELHTFVSQSLESKDVECENEVFTVYLFHEPGAGGTTSAREILWSLRKKYRCCVLKQFTEQTLDQFKELFEFKDDCPKPLLILIDNENEETLTQIILGLEMYLKKSKMCCPTFCVLLICFRTVFVPFEKRKLLMVKLKQFLCQEELDWFQRTYKDLKNRFENPKSLISFNILKENFNKRYIQNTVREFVKDVKDPNEEMILKFLSLINTFDLEFNAIPVSCFDVIMKSRASYSVRPAFSAVTKGGRKTSWEANVSQSFKVLLNLNDQKKQSRKTVRVFNKLTAEQILIAFKAKSGESEGDLVLSLLTKDIFENEAQEMKKFQDILTSMIKHRGLQEGGMRREKFSPLILSVRKKEGIDKVKKIMTTLFRLNKDPYTAQQIARFHIMCQEFENAEFYAKEAVETLSWNAPLWNTYAQVYKIQLLEKTQNKGQCTENELKELIALCMRSTELFRHEQSLSLNMTGNSGEAGYFGELESIELIIKAVWKYNRFESDDKAKEITHKYLVNESYFDKSFEFLSTEERIFLKGLLTNSKEAIRILDDRYLQLKEEIVVNPLSVLVKDNKKKLVDLKAFFNTFFGEKCDNVPRNLNDEGKCSYRSRIVMFKGVNSLSDVLHLKRTQKESELKKCYFLLRTNVKSEFASLTDFERILDIVTVLILGSDLIPAHLKFQDILRWTKQLHEISWRENSNPRLEVFMYFALYNFPTEERLKFGSLAPAPDLQSVLKSWKETLVSLKKNRYYLTHKQTTLFFLGNGPPLRDIVYQQIIDPLFDQNSAQFAWDSPILCKVLRPLEGKLLPGGDYVNFTYQRSGAEYEIKIKTSHPICKDILWRHKIYFYLGFSFSGLKAFGMTAENPLKSRESRASLPECSR